MKSARRRLLIFGPVVVALAAAAVLILRNWTAPPEVGRLAAGARPPNIVFILVDALRADRLGVYGGQRALTPAMDALAAEGTCFDRVIAQAPWTQPSVASLFCSYHPSVHGVQSYSQAWQSTFGGQPKVAAFSPDFTTLAEALAQAGYETAGFSANPFVIAEYGYAQGFAHFDARCASFDNQAASGAAVNAAALAWLAGRDARRPFFLYLHYMDVHGPYQGDPDTLERLVDEVERLPERRTLSEKELQALQHLRRLPVNCRTPERHQRLMSCREYWVARYEAGVRQADLHVAALRDRLIELGLWQSAYVILTSDHGEALCEHGFWDHGLSLHHNQLWVPLILRWPGVVAANRRVAATARLIDLYPTLLDQLRAPPPPGVQGRSLVPLLRGQAVDVPAFAESVKAGTEQRALYRGNRKVIFVESEPPMVALFDLARDPAEQHDLADPHSPALRELVALLQQQRTQNFALRPARPAAPVSLSEAERRRLESLGYLGTARPPESAPATAPGPP